MADVRAGPVLPVYARDQIVFSHGRGMRLFDTAGQSYLDFISGIAVNALGHCHPALVAALSEQAARLWHVSNMYRIEGQEDLARRHLSSCAFADHVFYSNSGSEAIECALKIARRYHNATGNADRCTVITFEGSFHGRSMAAISAAANPAHTGGFAPLLAGFVKLPFCDAGAVREALDAGAGAVLIEPVQGEGGVRAVAPSFLSELRSMCDASGALLIYDEVQSGAGRTGKLFAHDWAGDAAPDILALAKGIGSGFPLGACLATRGVGRYMTVGSHGSTHGGNPLAMAVGIAVWDIVSSPDFLESVRSVADHLERGLVDLGQRYSDVIVEVRGKGLLRGLKLDRDPRPFRIRAREHGLLIGTAGDMTIRLAPPLIASRQDVEAAVSMLDEIFRTTD